MEKALSGVEKDRSDWVAFCADLKKAGINHETFTRPSDIGLAANVIYGEISAQDELRLMSLWQTFGSKNVLPSAAADVSEEKKDAKEESVEELRKRANGGDAEAQYRLGEILMQGKGTAIDKNGAFANFSRAAEKKHPKAIYCVGLCCERGIGTDRDVQKAVQCYKEAADLDEANAQLSYAVCCQNGTGVAKNLDVAFEYYVKSAEKGNPRAMLMAGAFMLTRSPSQDEANKATRFILSSANAGDADAQYTVANFFFNGDHGLPMDKVKALHYFTLAADKGHVEAQYHAGLMNNFGEGVPENPKKAFKYFKKAADAGHIDAQFHTGVCYGAGRGVDVDRQASTNYFLKASVQGHTGAQKYLSLASGM